MHSSPRRRPLAIRSRAARTVLVLAAAVAFARLTTMCGSGISAKDAGPSALDATANEAGSVEAGGSPSDGGATSVNEGGTALLCADSAPPWTDPGVAAPGPDPALAGQSHSFFKIAVVDSTDAAVPGATLTTTNQTTYTTDQNGIVAYYEPGLMGTSVYFSPAATGYSYPADSLGNVGVALTTTEGASGVIAMTKSGTPAAADAGTLASRLVTGAVPPPGGCFALRAIDGATTRGVPLVKMVTTAGDAYWSDSQGYVAYCDPDLLGRSVTFGISSDGYIPASGSSLTLTPTKGGSATVTMTRVNVAERLYRVTGEGIYRDSILLGLKTPLANPLIDGLVMGQDTPSTNLYEGKLYWIWQDTERPAYALGNFDSSGATSLPPDAGGLSPDLGMNAAYFVGADGFSRGMVNTAETGGPIWLGQLVNVLDPQGATKMYGRYYVARATNPSSALAVFDDATSQFDFVADYPAGATLPSGRPTVVAGASGAYAYWSNAVRFPATVAGVTALSSYEAFTAYGSDASTGLATNADGTLAYAWTPGAAPVTPAAAKTAGVASDQVLDGHLTDVATGANVAIAGDSAIFNDYRKRFSKIVQQQYGSPSFLGETWYAEADSPLGPWVFARKVVSHDDGYTFYNPDLIPYFSEERGRLLFFDATYTATYTNLTPTPRYNYNEILYRIDLDDPRLVLPVAVYERGSGSAPTPVTKSGIRPGDPAIAASFFAYDRAASGAVPLAWSGPSCAPRRLVAGGAPATTPVFYALPAGAASSADGGSDAGSGLALVPLYEYAGPGGAYVYGTDAASPPAGFTRGAAVAAVWPPPIRVALPIADFLGDLVADAGPDQCVESSDAGATVTLDASASRDLAGAITSFVWVDATTGCAIATGETATVTLARGLHDVRLDAQDAAGNRASDEVIVEVSGP